MTIILDPGHGLGNRREGKYDPGAVSDGFEEAAIVMDWANEIMAFLKCAGHKVVRTRINASDAAAVWERADIARRYKGQVMLSLHCNAATGQASGTECFYRGASNKAKAAAISKAVAETLGIRDRGAKTESSSQHSRLAVMDFQPCYLLEIGFIDNDGDRAKMMSPDLRAKACEALAELLAS
jgi:N-acetylmuramoyl-L-alanine amidase